MNPFQLNQQLFENRNKLYGAYAIRTRYSKRLAIALLGTLTLFSLLAFGKKFIPETNNNVKIFKYEDTIKVYQLIKLDIENLFTEKNTRNKKITPKNTTKKNVSETNNYTPTDSAETNTNVVQNTQNEDSTGNDNNLLVFNLEKTGTGSGTDNGDTSLENETIVNVPDKNPEFPGGVTKLYEFIKSKVHYPEIAMENNITGTVYVTFVVDAKGKVMSIKSLNKVNGGCTEEAIRVVGLFPEWKPGVYQGKNVSVQFTLPITFRLN